MLESIEGVINSGSCSGCGACAVAEPNFFKMAKGENGIFLPTRVKTGSAPNAARVCPFSSQVLDDRKSIGASKAGYLGTTQDLLGSYVHLGAGRILSEDVWSSSSGGLTTWLLCKLLENGFVDGIIHLGSSTSPSGIFEYKISRTISEIHENRGSKYYATNFQDAMEKVKADDLKYAFVGVPCFINAVDLLRVDSKIWRTKIGFTIGLVCGHLKSEVFTQALSWQLDVAPDDISLVNYRLKDPNSKSSDYSFAVKSKKSDRWASRKSRELLAANWGHSAFALPACNSCTDLFGYTSDVTLGDAWLDRYENESRGTNILVVRNPLIYSLLQTGVKTKAIFLENLSSNEVVESQLGGVRHRVEGYMIRNSSKYRIESPQSDFSHSFPKHTHRRRLLVLYRSFISNFTSNQKVLADYETYSNWRKKYRLLSFVYGVLDFISRFNLRKLASKLKFLLRAR